MKIDRIRRRAFLQGAGAVSVALPVLPSLIGTSHAAPQATPLRRLIVLNLPYGTINDHWFPLEAARTGMRPLADKGTAMPLAEIAGPLSTAMGSAFDSVRDEMVLLDGIDGPWGMGHQRTFPLTGFTCDLMQGCNYASSLPGSSVDQIIADRALLYDGAPSLRSITLASGPAMANLQWHGESLSFRNDGGGTVAVPHYHSPATAHGVLFANVATGGDSEAMAAFERRKQQRLSVVDAVLADYAAVRQSGRLSTTDQMKLDAYIEHLAALEGGIGDGQPLLCSPPAMPNEGSYPNGDLAHEQRLRDHVTNVVHAVRCDATRVIALDFARDARDFPGLGAGDHHNLWHDWENGGFMNSQSQQILSISEFLLSQVAELVNGLDVEEDPGSGRTFLDNSLVAVVSDMGSVNNHRGCRMPVLLFGGRDVINRGLLVDYRTNALMDASNVERNDRIGISYNTFLITLCQAFGLAPEDYEAGQDGIGMYTLDNDFNYYIKTFAGGAAGYDAYAYGNRKDPLPGILL